MHLHDGQRRCLLKSRRFTVVPCGRRWGKTTMGIAMAYYGVPHAPGALAAGFDVGWFAPTYKLIDEAWRQAKRFLAPVSTRVDGSMHRIEIGKAALDFWNISDDAGRGRKYGLVIIDEAAISENFQTAWEQAIRPTLVDHRGAAFFFSTPKGFNFFWELSERKGDDWAKYHASSYDNPLIPASEIDLAREELPEMVFAQEHLYQFVTFGDGLVCFVIG
jgi:hypothetical protein